MKYINDRKAAQLAAFFLRRAGGKLSILKLVKLMYLADREHLIRYWSPITMDHFVSMPHGPVPTATLDLINGMMDSKEWQKVINGREGKYVSLRDELPLDLDELSELEEETAQEIFDQFGNMTAWKLRNWTHDNCPEWQDPDGSSMPITYADILHKVGRLEKSKAEKIAAETEALRKAALAA
ncbi:Panacea domain-containing protein [Alcanivorax sp.]|uniref:Panacea domain-containing protein n=1 Tax=Alcanivorax sp. TaxID=1872427 RepID=UPI00258F89EB|nr:Panacea domain-containing protein [Alcanivorax sp.]